MFPIGRQTLGSSIDRLFVYSSAADYEIHCPETHDEGPRESSHFKLTVDRYSGMQFGLWPLHLATVNLRRIGRPPLLGPPEDPQMSAMDSS